jgi:polysaccharide pyruvyl transferase WcaK-like protein
MILKSADERIVIHIRGGGFRNKGAELMLVATAAAAREKLSDPVVAVNYQLGTIAQRRHLDLSDLFWVEHHDKKIIKSLYNRMATLNRKRGLVSEDAVASLLQPGDWTDSTLERTLKRLRLVNVSRGTNTILGNEVNILLDISGYAYGDAWGPRNAEIAATYYAEIRRQGGKVVLLPQQLGPFDRKEVRDAFRRMADSCDVIYARDPESMSEASKVLQGHNQLRMAPDFTVLQEGALDHGYQVEGHACIVPNYRMLEGSNADVAEEYPRFLERCILHLRENSIPSVVVVHEQDERDNKLAHDVANRTGVDVISESDPLKLKGLIGSCYLMVGSRFHGLVSALSQNVPAVGTGWSHKYQMLFKDYDQADALLSVDSDQDRIAECLAPRLNPESHETERARLQVHSERHKTLAKAMWTEIWGLVDAG